MLAVLAVTTATLAVSQYESWRQSASNQAAFTVGSDVSVDTPVPMLPGQVGSLADAQGVLAATPVAIGTNPAGGSALALDPRTAGAAVILRPDLSALPLRTLWQRIIPSGRPAGLPLPGRPARIKVTATLRDSSMPKLAATVTIALQDRFGIVYRIAAGPLLADGRDHALVAPVTAGGQAGDPLRLLGLSLTYQPSPATPGSLHRSASTDAAMMVKDISLADSPHGGFARPFADGRQLAAWLPAAADSGVVGTTSPGASPAATGLPPSVESWRPAAAGAQELAFRLGFAPVTPPPSSGQASAPFVAEVTLTAPVANRAIPAIATHAFLQASGSAVGEKVPLSFAGYSVPAVIVATVTDFPTVTGTGGALIVDQTAVQAVLASRWSSPLPITTWWLRTAGGAVPPGLPSGTLVTDRERETEKLLADPLTAMPQQGILAVAVAVAILAALGFAVSVAARRRAGRLEGALLSALGMSRAAQAGRLCAEELMLAAPAAAAGLAAGIGLSLLIVPAITPAPANAPPVQVVLPLPWFSLIALAVAAIPVLLATTGSVGIGSDAASHLRVAEVP